MPKHVPAHPNNVASGRTLISAAYSLKVSSKRILLMCLAQMNKRAANEKNNPDFIISAASYQKLFGIDGSDARKEVKEGIKDLHDSDVVFYNPTPQISKIEVKWLLRIMSINSGTVNAFNIITIHPDIWPYFYDLESGFAKFNIQEVSELSSSNQIRLYEDCILHRNAANKSFTMNMDEFALRYKFSASVMSRPALFKTKFLDKAITAINKSTPLFVSYVNSGRDFQFYIAENPAYKK